MLILTHQGQSIEINPDVMIIIQNVTLDQYEKFANEDLKLDYDGECLFIHSPATYQHEKLVFAILKIFDRYFEEFPGKRDALGSHFSVKLPNGKRSEPDIVAIPPKSVKAQESVFEGIPYLVLEVLSPTTRLHDLNEKKSWYMENKIPEIWFIDPEEEELIVFYHRGDGEYFRKNIRTGSLKSKIFEGFTIEIQKLFETV